jgi:hypothetical protein
MVAEHAERGVTHSSPTPIIAISAAPNMAPAAWTSIGPVPSTMGSPRAAVKASPKPVGYSGGDQTEDGSDERGGEQCGEQNACAVRRGEIGEGGAGVAELATGDDEAEDGGEDHRPAGLSRLCGGCRASMFASQLLEVMSRNSMVPLLPTETKPPKLGFAML